MKKQHRQPVKKNEDVDMPFATVDITVEEKQQAEEMKEVAESRKSR